LSEVFNVTHRQVYYILIETKVVFSDLFRKYSVALVRKRTIPTERPPPVGEVSANFCE